MLLHAAADEVLVRFPWARGHVTPAGDGRCEYRAGDVSLDYLAMRIGMLGFDFEVLEPDELADRFGALAKRFRAAVRRSAADA